MTWFDGLINTRFGEMSGNQMVKSDLFVSQFADNFLKKNM